MLERLQSPHFVTWEEVLAEIGDEGLMQFYRLCKCFNRKSVHRKQSPRADRQR